MGWLIGVDEAGYGPNLGPLAIAATAWRVDGDSTTDIDLYAALSSSVSRESTGDRIAIADSKQLYKPGGGLRLLERGVWSALRQDFEWSAVLDQLDADPKGRRLELPWHKSFDPLLPLDAERDELAIAQSRLRSTCEAEEVRPPIVRARLVFPAEFNDLVDRYDTKGAALSHATLGLLKQVIDATDGGTIRCVLDKHGGRNRYAGLLQHHFSNENAGADGQWIRILAESRAESRYAWGSPDATVEASFQTGGEAFLPTALASMTAKYLREISMRAFNEFWTSLVEDLKPTAGYPVDAKRFKKAIAAKQQQLGISDRILWRCR